MRATMMTIPLQVSRLLDHGSTVHGAAEVVTWTGADSDPRRMSFAEVGRRAAQLAWALRELGVSGDDRVATLMWNNAEHLVAYLAVPSMGAVLHPLNVRLSPAQLVYVSNHAQDRVVLVDSAFIGLLADVLPMLPTVEQVIVVGSGDPAPLQAAVGVAVHIWDGLLQGRPERCDWPVVDEHDAAALSYTSGTTGQPKGVAYSHRSIWLHSMQACMAEGFALSPTQRHLVLVSMYHSMAGGVPYAAFMSGTSLVMPDRYLQAASIAQMIATERPTTSGAVPTIWTDLLSYLDRHPTDTSSLKEATVGGAACPPALMHAYADRHDIQLLDTFGMTETSPYGAIVRLPAGVGEAESWAYRSTQGRIPAAVETRIVDSSGVVLPADGTTAGELEVRGPWVTARYIGDSTPDPERFRAGWLRTGDIAKLSADGFITLTDRARDVIKSGGEWISSVELEKALTAHPAVLEACVVGVPDARWGERPLATVVLRDGATASVAQLRTFLERSVARWQVPERWAIVAAIPRTSVGKFDKKQLQAAYANGELRLATAAAVPPVAHEEASR